VPITRNLKQKHTDGFTVDHVQSLTGGSTGEAVLGYGVTQIAVASGTESATTEFTFRLNPPVAPGVHKFVVVSGASASTKTIRLRTLTSEACFFGSTVNQFSWSTTVNNPSDGLHLVGLTSTVWALLNRKFSTAGTLAGATA
jgi:hypothetical protein